MIKSKRTSFLAESTILVLYAVIWILISHFHEPWLDEAQAWQIAKCASIRDILFSIPHYEGHPPLWHLILAIPAKLGVPYELGLKSVGFLFSLTSAALIIFKAPFPKWIRFLLPFSYFPFYQYGIVVRSYSIMVLAFLLVAITFSKKNEHPWKFVFSLMLLCLTSAYGILFAGGITIAWLIEILIIQKQFREWWNYLSSHKMLLPLVSLLFLAITILLLISSYDDTMVDVNAVKQASLFKRVFYYFFALISDALITNVVSRSCFVSSFNFSYVSLLLAVLIGIIIYCFIFLLSDGKNWIFFVIPHVLFVTFSFFVYFHSHHIGLDWLLLLFWVWSTAENKKLIYNIEKSYIISKKVHSALFVFPILFLSIPLFWSCTASVNDIKHNYSEGREISVFLKENNLSDLKIMCNWERKSKEDSKYSLLDTNNLYNAVPVCPYFDKNIFINLNNGNNSLAYLTHKRATDEINDINIQTWKTAGKPDVFIGLLDFETLTGNAYDIYQYAPVYQTESQWEAIWKGNYSASNQYIFIRKDLLEKYGLNQLEVGLDFAMNTGLVGFVYPEYLEILGIS